MRNRRSPEFLKGLNNFMEIAEKHVNEEGKEKIQNELRKMKDEAGESSVDEVECLKRALGERCGHIRGIGRKLRSESSFLQGSTSKSQQQNATNAQVLALSEQFSQYLQ